LEKSKRNYRIILLLQTIELFEDLKSSLMDLTALRFVVRIPLNVIFNKDSNYSGHLVATSTNWGRQAIRGERSPGSEMTSLL
jgi:hypothetical protein